MESKIAIMTWYSYNNYGSILQAYAIKKVISDLNFNHVDFVKYEPRIRRTNSLKDINFKKITNKLLSYHPTVIQKQNEKKEKFELFREKYFTYTKICDTKTDLYSLNDEYYKFVCGSDQIWAPTVYDENYFLDFVNNNDKKIAYAPSIGLNEIQDEQLKSKMKNQIENFKFLSIREERGREIIRDLCEKDAKVVLDPTLLLTRDTWERIFNLTNFEKKDYILIYCLGNSKQAYSIAKKIAKNEEEIIVVPGKDKDFLNKNIYNASPEEFLKLIFNAKLVITDSYHGTLFSINLNVPFITLKRFKDDENSQNSRIYNILKIANAENRLYDNNLEYFTKNIQMDFKIINERIDKKRKESREFLINALKKENEIVENKKITNVCTGCSLCIVACPQKCIDIKLNDEGFFEYLVDEKRCINCGVCKKTCAQVHNEKKSLAEMKLYSAYSNDEEVLKKSSSGGIAYEISKLGIEKKYEVIGCTYDYEIQKAKHIKINSIEDIKLLSGSKYIQSYTKDAFSEISKVDKGIVIGTPCQIASIDNYLKIIKKREKFILVDLICHGVPSYLLWNKFTEEQRNVEKIKFRDKKYGWRNYTLSINDKKSYSEGKCLFYDFFTLGNIYNTSCYECNYRSYSCADIRLGDYWGQKFRKNTTGMSMVISCTTIGDSFIKELKKDNRIVLKVEDIKDYFNVQQTKNSVKPIYYDTLIKDFRSNDYTLKELSDKYCRKEKRYRKVRKNLSLIYHKIKGA